MDPQIGPYRILEKLGVGGMGEVYLAEDTRLARKVALKRLSDPTLSEPDAHDRLLREARAAAGLNHPNIAVIYDVMDVGGRAYIVMEYVPGETLADRLARGPLARERVAELGRQLCDAVAEAHAHGIIHRDLKPANVRVTPEGRVKVLDFGLAVRRVVNASGAYPPETAIGSLQLVGTPVYMAPEVLMGHAPDARSDIYGVGVTLFELATGRPPYQQRDLMALAAAIRDGRPPDPEQEIRGGLGRVIARAMERDPDRRYPSALHLRQELAALSQEISDAPTQPVDLPPPRRRRGRWLVGAAGALLLTVLAALIGWFIPEGASDGGPAVVAVLPFRTTSDSPARAHLGLGIAPVIEASLHLSGRLAVVTRPSIADGDAPGDPGAVARELGATMVVFGSVQILGERVLLTAQVWRSRDGRVVSAVSEQGEYPRYMDLQQTLAERLRGELVGPLETPAPARALPTASVDLFNDYTHAQALLARRNVPGSTVQAIEILKRITAQDPRFADALALLAEAYLARFFESKEPAWAEEAASTARAAAGLAPDSPRVRYALALILHETGRSEQAEEELRRLVDGTPPNDDALRLLGEIRARGGDLEGGLAYLRQALAIRPEYWRHHEVYWFVLYRAGRYEEALEPGRRLAQLRPDMASAFQRLGATYQQLERADEAIAEYRKALQIAPTPGSWSNIALLHYRAGRYEEAAQAYEQALSLEPTRTVTHRNLGDALRRVGREEEARRAYERAIALTENELKVNPTAGESLALQALCLAKLGRRQEAERNAARAVTLSPSNPEVLYRQAVVSVLLGAQARGLEQLRAAIAAGYNPRQAALDDDLRTVRGLPAFVEIVDGH